MSGERTALQILGDEAMSLTMSTVSEKVRQQASLCVLDTVGCMLAGSRTEEALLILRCESDEGSMGQITIPGTSHRRSLTSAIRINGYLGDILELNDLIGGHASIGTVTVALALAEEIGASGTALLEAVIRGIEITTRVYDAVYPKLKRYTDMGLVPVGIPSSIGTAAAAARLLELDAEQTVHAMSIAGALSGWCPAEVIFGNGGTMKPLLFGTQPALAGLTGAFYAKKGMTGPISLLDSKVGFFSTASDGGMLVSKPENRRLALEQPRRKLHACCGYIHSAADATRKLLQRTEADLKDGNIEIHVPPYVADVVSKTALPKSANDARFHLQYCIALVLCGNEVILPEHSVNFYAYLSQPAVRAALERVKVVADPALTHYHQCEVICSTSGHPPITQKLDAPRGSPNEPLTDQDVREKFLRLASPVIGRQSANQFLDDTLGLGREINVRTMLRSLVEGFDLSESKNSPSP